MTLTVGPIALAAIIGFEVTDQRTYERRYQFPTWPGGGSGVTVGIGFDLGYEDEATVRAEIGDKIPPPHVDLLCSVIGLRGAAANNALRRVAEVVFPWPLALEVFRDRTLPRYIAATDAAFPNCGMLPPDAFGALVSLVYNRGAGMADDPHDAQHRRLEMRQIRAAMSARLFDDVPGYIRSMERLWKGDPDLRGLIVRREREAQIFEDALKASPLVEHEPAAPVAAPRLEVAPVVVPFPRPAPPQPQKPELTADDLNARELSRIQQDQP